MKGFNRSRWAGSYHGDMQTDDEVSVGTTKGFQITLPMPVRKGRVSVEEAIARRQSVRAYRSEPLTLSQLSQLLWAAQGLVGGGRRTAPSAGASYPLEIFVFISCGGVERLDAGIYRYNSEAHSLTIHKPGDFLKELARAALDQSFIAQAPLNILVAAIYERTSRIYGRRAERYVPMEVGHVGQNIHLQAEALALGTVVIGAFDDEEVARVLSAEKEARPLYIMPIGKPK